MLTPLCHPTPQNVDPPRAQVIDILHEIIPAVFGISERRGFKISNNIKPRQFADL